MSDPQQYAPMPSEPEAYRPPPAAGTPPSPVVTAVRLMFVGVLLSIIGIVVVLSSRDSLRKALRDSNSTSSAKHIDDLVNAAVGVTVAVGVIVVVLYILLALQVRRGRNWARIVTWVLAGLGALSALTSLARTGTGWSKTVAVISGVLDVAIIVLLATPASHAWFRSRGGQQYPVGNGSPYPPAR